MSAPDDEESGFRRMTISEHLDELRSRMIRALLWLGLGLVVCLIFNDHVMRFILKQPLDALRELGQEPKLVYYAPTEGFAVWLKLALIVAAIFSSPLMAREVWGFVAAGLYPHEKRWVQVFAPFSYLLFLGGAAFLYFAVFPTALRFLLDFGMIEGLPEVQNLPRVSEYLSLYIVMSLLMGLVFQLPLVMLFFMAVGIVEIGTFRKYRKHFIVGAVAVMAVVSPTGDAATLVLISVPVVLLYEIGILLGGALIGRKKRKRSES